MSKKKKTRVSESKTHNFTNKKNSAEVGGKSGESTQLDEVKSLIQHLDLKRHSEKSFVVPEDYEESSDELETSKNELADKLKSHRKMNREKVRRRNKVQDDEISSSTDRSRSARFDWKQHMSAYKPRKYLLVKLMERWYDEDETVKIGESTDALMSQMEFFAAKLLSDELELYKERRQKSKGSDSQWLGTVLSSGTLTDKMSAMTVLCGESPVHNLASIESLIAMAKKKGKREAMLAAEALKDLFLSNIIPSERKLRNFHEHSLVSLEKVASGNKDVMDKVLILWAFEDKLKVKYMEYIKAVDVLSFDTLAAPKQKAISIIFQLLANKPEGEKMLLPMLANKLGDPNRKIATKASYMLTKLVHQHPNMNSIVVSAVEVILYRSNISPKAQYYSLCFLNQTVLDHESDQLAAQLIKIYFSFFQAFLKKGNVDNYMISALLTGIHRAFPYSKGDMSYLKEEVNSLYRLVHLVKFSTSIQALLLLQHITEADDASSDRFYMALYKKLSDPALKNCSKQGMFLNIIFKTLKKDTSEKRIKAFLKRLLQVCAYHSPSFICGVLIMLSQVLLKRPEALNFQPTVEDSDDEEHFNDIPDEEDSIPCKPTSGQRSSWVHRHDTKNTGDSSSREYDPYHRNPLYCGAERACLWELKKLSMHFHPSVSLFATSLLKKTAVTYTSDPLQDFTLIRFLDRFVYRNPKTLDKVQKSKMSSAPSRPVYIGPVCKDTFLNKTEDHIPEHEKYLHKYFSVKSSRDKSNEFDQDSDAGSVGDDEFDRYLDKFEGNTDKDDLFGDYDFAGDYEKSSKNKKKGKPSSDSEDDEEEDVVDDDLDFDADDDTEMREALGEDQPDWDEEDIEFSDDVDVDADDDDGLGELTGKKRKAHFKGDKDETKKMKHKTENWFASAEEFAEILEDNSGINLGGIHAMSNKDNAGLKQLKWEQKRDDKIAGKDWRTRKHKQTGKHSSKKGEKAGPGMKVKSYGSKGKAFKGKGGKRK